MTVRDFIQKILLSAPDLEATIYVSKMIDDIEAKSYDIINISNGGSNDSVNIWLKDYENPY